MATQKKMETDGAHLPETEDRVARGELAATQATLELLALYKGKA